MIVFHVPCIAEPLVFSILGCEQNFLLSVCLLISWPNHSNTTVCVYPDIHSCEMLVNDWLQVVCDNMLVFKHGAEDLKICAILGCMSSVCL
jgi:hypothetical protein